MVSASGHGVCATPALLCIVDDPFGRLDPVLVVQTSNCASAEGVGADHRFVDFLGDLDSSSARRVRHVLEAVAGDGGDVVVDLAGVSFCDGAGMRLIEHFQDQVVANGGHVSVHAPTGIVRRLISILGIDAFDLCEAVTSSRRSLRDEPSRSSARRVWKWDGRTDHFDRPQSVVALTHASCRLR